MMDQRDFDECVQVVANCLLEGDKAVFLDKMRNIPAKGTIQFPLPSGRTISATRDGDIWEYSRPDEPPVFMDEYAFLHSFRESDRDYAIDRYNRAMGYRACGFSVHIGNGWIWIDHAAVRGHVYTTQSISNSAAI